MTWISLLVAALLFAIGAVCVFLVLVQLPGTWLFLAFALAVELLDALYLPPEARTTFGRSVWIAGLVLAVLGELLEFVASAIGLQKGGGSRRGLVGALVGALLGFLLTPLFAFVPLFGPFLAVLLGTFVGAWLGELSHARHTLDTAVRPALWAALGRLLGTTGKVALACAIWILFTGSALWSA